MRIHLIWAQDKNGGIGKNGKLPWHIPEDLKNFKKLTLDYPVIMGRKTWESLFIQPLPRRRNIVLTSTKIETIECYETVTDCITLLKKENVPNIFVIGGAKVYKTFYPMADELHISRVKEVKDGIDTFFPIKNPKIQEEFKLEEEKPLTPEVTYCHWVRK